MHVRQGNAKRLGPCCVMWSSCRWKTSRLQWCYLMCFLADFTANQKKENLSAMIKRFKETQASQIMVAPVAADEVE